MKKAQKVPKNFQFEMICLAVAVRRDFSFDVQPLRIKTDWLSLKGLNSPDGRMRTKNKKLVCYLRAQNTQKKRDELMRKCRVLFD